MKKQHIMQWGGVLARFFTVELVLQAATAAAGIFIIRMLQKSDYGHYAVALAFVSTATAFTDCGVSIALSALGGKVWQDNEALGTLIVSALAVRKWLVGIVTLGVGGILPPLLLRDGDSLASALSVTAVVITSLLAQFGIGLYTIVPRLRANYGLLQGAPLLAIVIRWLLLILVYCSYRSPTAVLLANCVGLAAQLWLYQRHAKEQVNLKARVDPGAVREILSIVRKQFPYELYGAASGQIGVLIISIFGNSGRVAEVGALGRLALIFTTISGVMSNVLLPRFARCQDPARLLPLYLKILGLYCIPVGSVLVIGWLFPAQLISVLGHNYAGLEKEWLLALGSAVLNAIMVAAWGLNISRGWIIPAWIGVGVGIGAQICGILLFDIRTVHGVFELNFLVNAIGLVCNFAGSAYFLKSHHRSLARAST
jgi:O-antigen/teichoic acid export membrane protein